ncbi:MAG: methyltransferase domain-containing protein [Candidatus Vogelbacteria bacterium]|nr:methyltransferase domain-containing protein [Candidatus Vogelbacteria bacterium]
MTFADPKENIKNLDLKEGDIVVDFGTGSGHYAVEAGKRVGDKGIVYAIDVNKASLEHLVAKAKDAGLGNVDVIWADADEIGGTKLKDNLADAVILSNVLFQSENKDNMVKEAGRILKVGGEALIIDWDTALPGLGPTSSQVITVDKVEEIFTKSRFTPFRKFNAGEHHFGLVFKKL